MAQQKEIKQIQKEKRNGARRLMSQREYRRRSISERLTRKISNTLCSKCDKQYYGRELKETFRFKTEEISVENSLATLKFDEKETNTGDLYLECPDHVATGFLRYLNEFVDRNYFEYKK